MAGSRFYQALSFLSLVTSAFSAPLTSPRVPELSARGSPNICDASSKCKPFKVELTWETVNPTNGIARKAVLMNGSIPGPALSMKVGDCVDFIIVNNLPDDTGVHFHGITQEGTPWADGTPGLSQYAVKPGDTYMYQWTAHESGIYFYHSHYKGQMMDGLYGAILIAPADDADKPFSQIPGGDVQKLNKAEANVEPIFVSDWSQYTFNEFYQIQENANIDNACTDTILLNGLGSVYCLTADQIKANASPVSLKIAGNQTLTAKGCIPASNAATQGNYTRNLSALPDNAYNKCNAASNKNFTVKVDPKDGWAAISLINPGGFSLLKTTIDNHKLYVYELNGNYIVPQVVDQVTVSNGDRISFFVKLDQDPADYTIRIANSGVNQVISGFGTLSYKGSSGPASSSVALMNFGGQNSTAIKLFSELHSTPYPAKQVSATADASHKLSIHKTANQPDAYRWTLSGISSYDESRDDAKPLLYQDPNSIPDSDLIIKTQKDSWVDLIIEVPGPLAQPHPLHKHANKFFVIGTGVGSFTWDSVASAQAAGIPFNTANPPYLDGFTTLPNPNGTSWVVFRYKAEIPGVWFFHCHIQTHFSGGMAIAILDGVDDFPTIPSDVGKVCTGADGGNSTGDGSNGGSWNDWNGTGSGNGSGNGNGSSDNSGSGSGNGNGNGSGSGNGNGSSNSDNNKSSDSSNSNSGSGNGNGNGNSNSNDNNKVAPYTGAASSMPRSSMAFITLIAVAIAATMSL